MDEKKVKLPFPAYTGTEPYIFASYSHKDSDLVFPELLRLNKMGFRIWYDEGITPGSEWSEEIENAIKDATMFIVFMSEKAVNSRNVRNEINFAFDENKRFLVMYLEEAVLKFGLKLMLSSIQAIKKYELPDEIYVHKLMKIVPDVLGESPKVKSAPLPDSFIQAKTISSDIDGSIKEEKIPDKENREMADEVIAGIDSQKSDIRKVFELQNEKTPEKTKPEVITQIPVKKINKGDQLWMLENLNVDTYRNGDMIPQAKTPEDWEKKQGAWCYYNNNSENGKKIGKLYNWYAVNDPRGLAPAGWHIPDILELESIVNAVNEDESVFSIKNGGNLIEIKSEFGLFSTPLSGNRLYNGDFSGLGEYAYLWSSSDAGDKNAYRLRLKPSLTSGGLSLLLNNKAYGFSVRCIKDY